MANKALLVGINQYKNVSPLRGCLNDLATIREALSSRISFAADNVRLIRDTEATKANVRKGLKWLLMDVQDGDQVIFHFSGHGSYVEDTSGDEEENLDEIICMYDMEFGNPGSYFIDDELRNWISQVPRDVNLTVILDSCHSGTGTRAIWPQDWVRIGRGWISSTLNSQTLARSLALDEISSWVSSPGLRNKLQVLAIPDLNTSRDLELRFTDPIARFVEPPLDIVAKRRRSTPSSGMRAISTANPSHVLLAACRADQTAADAYINASFNGAFSYYLAETLNASSGAVSYRSLIEVVSAKLAEGNYRQVPVLEPSDLSADAFRTTPSENSITAVTQPTGVSTMGKKTENAKELIDAAQEGIEAAKEGILQFFESISELASGLGAKAPDSQVVREEDSQVVREEESQSVRAGAVKLFTLDGRTQLIAQFDGELPEGEYKIVLGVENVVESSDSRCFVKDVGNPTCVCDSLSIT